MTGLRLTAPARSCGGRRRRRLSAVVGACATIALSGPPAAAQAPDWHDAQAGVPADVNLRDVAVHGSGVVVAVGDRPAATVEGEAAAREAAIYRLAGGVWRRDTIANLPPGSRLVAVAVTEQAAWAVGSYDDGGAKPLMVRFPGGGQALAGAGEGAAWSAVGAPADLAAPLRSVALAGGAGLVGAENGRIHRIDDGGPGGPGVVGGPLTAVPAADAVNAIALYGPGTGFAVGDPPAGDPDAPDPNAPDTRIYKLSQNDGPAGDLVLADSVAPGAGPGEILSVATAGAGTGVAVDRTGYWELGAGGVWSRKSGASFPEAGSDLHDAAMKSADGQVVEAIAGGIWGQGAVWRRAGSTWSYKTVGGASLNGVAISGKDDMWAIGDGGRVLHYYAKPVPPPSPAPQQPQSDPQLAPEPQPSQTEPSAQKPAEQRRAEHAPAPEIQIEERPAEEPGSAPPAKRPTRRLMTNVAVRRRRGRVLVISFRLTDRASVTVIARRGRRVVARKSMRARGKGAHRLVVRYRGKRPPTSLKIVVRPAGGAVSGRRS